MYSPTEAQLAHQLGHHGVLHYDASQHSMEGHAEYMSAQNGLPNGHYDNQQIPYDHMQGIDQYGMQSMAMAPGSGAEVEDRRKRGSAASATNDKELREILSRNDGRTLKDVAHEVLAAERTPRAEKTKQLFAMLWLRSVCKSSKQSVPRSRVYTSYAERCANERVAPLNPASFGKLVRVIFPGIQTRRLGVRGESKYHYVDLELIEPDQQAANEERAQSRHATESQASLAFQNPSIDFNSMPRLQADTAAFPSQDHVPEPSTSRFEGRPSFGRVYFPPADYESFQDPDTIELPDIHTYIPPKTDIDAADALTALYRTHCTSLVDCIRFCKEKQFFRFFTSFQGTLTVPVQKLLVHPDVAPWIKECDWIMYQKMIRFVSQLTLQVVPPQVCKFLNNISKNLYTHINKTFQGHPAHMLEAKLEPATLFANLLHRMLRANSTAHAAANLLITDHLRDQMWQDWVALVNPIRVMETELPNCEYEETYKILTTE
ncbi:hypothetical protein LTS18_011392, partial [Coniosporium uncinatum]